jgi:hypothetical protein
MRGVLRGNTKSAGSSLGCLRHQFKTVRYPTTLRRYDTTLTPNGCGALSSRKKRLDAAVEKLGTVAGRDRHRARDLAENGADAGGNARHDGAGSYRNESCHQSIFDEVLSARIFPDAKLPNQIGNTSH